MGLETFLGLGMGTVEANEAVANGTLNVSGSRDARRRLTSILRMTKPTSAGAQH